MRYSWQKHNVIEIDGDNDYHSGRWMLTCWGWWYKWCSRHDIDYDDDDNDKYVMVTTITIQEDECWAPEARGRPGKWKVAPLLFDDENMIISIWWWWYDADMMISYDMMVVILWWWWYDDIYIVMMMIW